MICVLSPLTGYARAADQLIRNFDRGSGLNAVGLIEANPGAGGLAANELGDREEIEGPQAIHAGDKGEIYILDQVNSRVLLLDPKRSAGQTRSLQLPEDAHPTDLVVLNENLYIWDGGPRALQDKGQDDGPVRSLSFAPAKATDDAVTSAFSQMGSEALSPELDANEIARGLGGSKGPSHTHQIVASHGKGQVTADVVPLNKSGVSIGLKLKNGSLLTKLALRVRSRIGAVEVLDIDRQGRIYVLSENIPTDSTDDPYTFVARCSQRGVLEGVFQLPFNKDVALSRRSVTVSPEGDVYFLRTRKDSVDLLGVGFRPLVKGQVVDLALHSASQSQPSLADYSRFKGVTAAVRVLNRAQAVETALQFANVRWRVNAGAYGPDPDRVCTGFNRIRRPGYLHGMQNQEVTGIPYCWGCHGSLPKIAATIGAGRLAGNVCTRDNPRFDVTGVDCSAFVSATWGLSTHFTTIAIPAIARHLTNPWDLLPGDALNKPGSHVMLFVRFTPDRRAEVIESSTGGCNGKVCRNIYPLASLLARGYRPVRYRGLANDTSAPAPVANKVAATPQSKTKRR